MRVSDIMKLARDDVRNSDGSMKQHITVIEKKTGKQKRFPLCNGLLVEMEKYTKYMKTGEYLFKSRKGENRPITTVQAYRIISEAAKRIDLEEIGTHTNREKHLGIGIINNTKMLLYYKKFLIIHHHQLHYDILE